MEDLTLIEAAPWLTSVLMILTLVWKVYFQQGDLGIRHRDGFVNTHILASSNAVNALSTALEELQRQVNELRSQIDTLKQENKTERELRKHAEQRATEAHVKIEELKARLSNIDNSGQK